jgi:CHAD domain-containing protein
MSANADLQTLVKRRVKALESHLPGAIAGDTRALHRARVASRRLREVLPLVTAPGAKGRRRVRRLTSWLGRVREMDVALALLGSRELEAAVSSSALAELRQHLHVTRERRREKLLRQLARFDRDKLSRRLARLFDEIPPAAEQAWRRVLAGRLARRAADLRGAVDQAGAIYVTSRLHGVRIAAKKLRYALEIAAETGISEAATIAAVVRRTQVTLGNLQDRHVLSRHVRAAADAADEPTRLALTTLESSLEASCRELHAQFLSQRESLAAALVAVRQQVVPALARQSARERRPLKSKAATTGTVTDGRSYRAVPDSTRARRVTRRRLA